MKTADHEPQLGRILIHVLAGTPDISGFDRFEFPEKFVFFDQISN